MATTLIAIFLFLIVCALAPDVMELIGMALWGAVCVAAFIAFWGTAVGLLGWGIVALVTGA
jgi:hypothetical protein